MLSTIGARPATSVPTTDAADGSTGSPPRSNKEWRARCAISRISPVPSKLVHSCGRATRVGRQRFTGGGGGTVRGRRTAAANGTTNCLSATCAANGPTLRARSGSVFCLPALLGALPRRCHMKQRAHQECAEYWTALSLWMRHLMRHVAVMSASVAFGT